MNKKSSVKPTCLQSESLIQPETRQPFPLELDAAAWLGFAKKLDEAMCAKTDTLELTPSEEERFEKNFELVRRVKTAEEVRNYAMLEIHEAKQWRASFRNVVELAKAFGLSKSQFYKSIKSAAINIQMARADLYDVKPTGRDVELLGKIDHEHRVEAWRCALAAASEKGGSAKVIERALDEYLERMNGNTKTGAYSGTPPLQAITVEVDGEVSGEGGDAGGDGWTANLDDTEEPVFRCLLTLDTWFATLKDPGISTGSSMAHELVSAATDFVAPNAEVENMRDAMRLAVKKDPRLKRGLYHLGLYLVSRHINANYRKKHTR